MGKLAYNKFVDLVGNHRDQGWYAVRNVQAFKTSIKPNYLPLTDVFLVVLLLKLFDLDGLEYEVLVSIRATTRLCCYLSNRVSGQCVKLHKFL